MFRRHPGKSESPDQLGYLDAWAVKFFQALVLSLFVWCQALGSRRHVPPGVEAMTWTSSPPSPSVSLILQRQTFEDFGGVKCTLFYSNLVGLHYVAAKSTLTCIGLWASQATACTFPLLPISLRQVERMQATVRYFQVIKYIIFTQQ